MVEPHLKKSCKIGINGFDSDFDLPRFAKLLNLQFLHPFPGLTSACVPNLVDIPTIWDLAAW